MEAATLLQKTMEQLKENKLPKEIKTNVALHRGAASAEATETEGGGSHILTKKSQIKLKTKKMVPKRDNICKKWDTPLKKKITI